MTEAIVAVGVLIAATIWRPREIRAAIGQALMAIHDVVETPRAALAGAATVLARNARAVAAGWFSDVHSARDLVSLNAGAVVYVATALLLGVAEIEINGLTWSAALHESAKPFFASTGRLTAVAVFVAALVFSGTLLEAFRFVHFGPWSKMSRGARGVALVTSALGFIGLLAITLAIADARSQATAEPAAPDTSSAVVRTIDEALPPDASEAVAPVVQAERPTIFTPELLHRFSFDAVSVVLLLAISLAAPAFGQFCYFLVATAMAASSAVLAVVSMPLALLAAMIRRLAEAILLALTWLVSLVRREPDGSWFAADDGRTVGTPRSIAPMGTQPAVESAHRDAPDTDAAPGDGGAQAAAADDGSISTRGAVQYGDTDDPNWTPFA